MIRARGHYHVNVKLSVMDLDWPASPLEVVRRWPMDRGIALLHSGRHDPRWARRSILAAPVGAYRFEQNGQSRWVGEGRCPVASFSNRPFADLRALIREGEGGLWIGYLGYDLARWVEKLPHRALADRDWPLVELGWCPGYAVHDALTGRWTAHGQWACDPPVLVDECPCEGRFGAGAPRSVFTPDEYRRAVARVIDYIAAGDVFQVNLAQRFTAALRGAYPYAPRALFTRLATLSPAWYGAYLELGFDPATDRARRAIASTSPELFLEVDPSGRVLTRPIKGTRPAPGEPGERERMRRELLTSAKDIAELNMIVDLMRNDLGRVCDYGSVRVTQPRVVERHPTIHHGVATIEGRLHPSRDIADLLRAAMPGGSVTGAPKVRAMQIIEELEPVRRGPYCGAIGYLGRDLACMNIAIRTMQIECDAADPRRDGRVDFSVGGGIVADSDPEGEYQETLDKAAAIMTALRALGAETVGAEKDQQAQWGGRLARHQAEGLT